jgi:transaldolase
VIITLPHAWQVRFNESGLSPSSRIDVPVDPVVIDELLGRFPDFVNAYEPDGLSVPDFDGYPCTRRTLRAFTAAYHDLVGAVRDVLLPNPDLRETPA